MKTDPVEQALNYVISLRSLPNPDAAVPELRNALRHRSNLVVAKAARITEELKLFPLIPDLLSAFERLMAHPEKLDKGCSAVTAIVSALYAFDYTEPAVYRRGLHHRQMEGSFGPPVDAAAQLRGYCAMGLARSTDRNAVPDVVSLLVDSEPPARLGAVRALAANGGDAGALALKLKALTGDRDPDVVAECFTGLLASGLPWTIPFVASQLDSRDEATAESAMLALGASRTLEAFAALKEKLSRTVDAPTRKILLAAIASSRLDEALEFLVGLVESGPASLAADSITALASYRSNDRLRKRLADAVANRTEKNVCEAWRRDFA